MVAGGHSGQTGGFQGGYGGGYNQQGQGGAFGQGGHSGSYKYSSNFSGKKPIGIGPIIIHPDPYIALQSINCKLHKKNKFVA